MTARQMILTASMLTPHPHNVRESLGDLRGLIKSISEVGIQQPLLVRPLDTDGNPTTNGSSDIGSFQIVAGHRRRAAALKVEEMAKEDVAVDLPLDVPVVSRDDMSEEDVIATMLVENLQRQDLTALEEARGYLRITEAGWTQKRLAAAVGVSQRTVSQRLKVLLLPAPWQEDYAEGRLTQQHVDELVEVMKRDDFTPDVAEEAATADNVKRILDERRIAADLARLREEYVTEDEPEIAKNASWDARTYFPKNHVAVTPETDVSLPYNIGDVLALDVEQLRTDGNLGWHFVTTTEWIDGERVKEAHAIPVCTDRGYYTRKSSSVPDEARPDGWEKEQAKKAEERERKAQERAAEEDRRQRCLAAVRAAKKSELEEVVVAAAWRDLKTQEVKAAFELMGVEVEESEVGHPHYAKAFAALSNPARLRFVALARMVRSTYISQWSTSELDVARLGGLLLEEYAPAVEPEEATESEETTEAEETTEDDSDQ